MSSSPTALRCDQGMGPFPIGKSHHFSPHTMPAGPSEVLSRPVPHPAAATNKPQDVHLLRQSPLPLPGPSTTLVLFTPTADDFHRTRLISSATFISMFVIALKVTHGGARDVLPPQVTAQHQNRHISRDLNSGALPNSLCSTCSFSGPFSTCGWARAASLQLPLSFGPTHPSPPLTTSVSRRNQHEGRRSTYIQHQ